jgi:hypothetical protein
MSISLTLSNISFFAGEGDPSPIPKSAILRSNGSISGMHVSDLTDGSDERVHIVAGGELAEADADGSFGKSPDGPVRCRGTMQPGAHCYPK